VNENQEAKAAPEAQPQGKANPSMEADVKRRVFAAVADEIARLEEFAESSKNTGQNEAYCHALEAMASIKARAEVYCIQVEMAAATAAMASIFGGAMRQRAAAQPAQEGPEAVKDLLRRVDSPGRKSPQGHE